jgi:hypothetical protein
MLRSIENFTPQTSCAHLFIIVNFELKLDKILMI